MSQHIWSLLEIVQNYNLWQLGQAIAWLKEVEGDSSFLAGLGNNPIVPTERIDNFYRPMVSYTELQCGDIKLTAAVGRCSHFLIALRNDSGLGLRYDELRHQAIALRQAIEGELPLRRFVFVPIEKAVFSDNPEGFWSIETWQRFSDARHDSNQAIDSYVFDLNTACVFHSMRVAEYGLRALAKAVQVKLTQKKGKPHPIEFADLDKVITAVKNKIDKSRQRPHGAKRAAILQFYSDSADHCTYMKDVWRNEVSHTRKSYSAAEALGVMQRVRDFMSTLAKGLK